MNEPFGVYGLWDPIEGGMPDSQLPSGSLFFFFSSRRRHTRWPRDWSSDVCSSDLGKIVYLGARDLQGANSGWHALGTWSVPRSEERRVGKECRCRWSPDDLKKKQVMAPPSRSRVEISNAHP